MYPTVMIASSNRGMCRALSTIFSYGENRVQTVPDAMACLDQVREEAPELLIVDECLLWGGVEGLLECLHSEGRLGRTKVVRVGELPNHHISAN